MKKSIVLIMCVALSLWCFALGSVSGGALLNDGQYVQPQSFLPFMNLAGAEPSAEIFTSKTITPAKYLKNYYQYTSSSGEELLYKCVGKVNNNYVFIVIYSSGGSGAFTNLFTASISGSSLIYGTNIAGGDRNNGGIKSALVDSNSVIYSIYATPYKIMSLTSVPSKYYANVNDGANVQAGFASYIYHLKTKQRELLSIQLSAQTGNGKYYNLVQDKQNGATSQQLAFEKLYNRYVGGGKSMLTHEDLKNFSKNYMKYLGVK